jgi:hypothetical protein
VQDQTMFMACISHCLIARRDKWQCGLWASMPQSNILVSKMRCYKSSMVYNIIQHVMYRVRSREVEGGSKALSWCAIDVDVGVEKASRSTSRAGSIRVLQCID